MGEEVNKTQLAKILGKSPKWIGNLVNKGMPVKSRGGRGVPMLFDTQVVIDWLIKHAIDKKFGSGDEVEQGSAVDEDIKLKRVRREDLQLNVDRKRGLLGPIDGMVEIAFVCAGIFNSQLDGLASRCAAEISLIDDPALVQKYLNDETRRIRAATSGQLVAGVRAIAESAVEFFDESGVERQCGPEQETE